MTVHLFEPGGIGGVYQHTVAVADLLAEEGDDVVLHTASDAEIAPRIATVCGCVSWERGRSAGGIRRYSILRKYLTRTVPHLVRHVGRDQCLYVQGRFRPGLLLLPILLSKARGAWVVVSPHNLFERSGGLLTALSLRGELRLADFVVVFSETDRARAHRMGVEAIHSPLVMHLPSSTPEQISRWRRRWDLETDQRVILFAGQLRPDKRLDLLLRAATELPKASWKVAVVGEDKGSEGQMRALAAELHVGVSWQVEYVEPSEFVAAIAAADVVCCPYDQASQSAVLAMAKQLNVPTVARDVGGLGELATVSVASNSGPSEIASACQLAADRGTDGNVDDWWATARRTQLLACRSRN